MGQNTYAEWFINTMLGWIRWIANGVANLFQSGPTRGSSSGGAFIGWFQDNWVALLIGLVAFGVLMDWIIWMIRWRPYWLWFRKKRVLLDDDIDAILGDEELMRKFAPPQRERPHFQSSQLGRGGRPIPRDELAANLYDPRELDGDYDDEFDAPDIEDPYDGGEPAQRHARVRDEDDDYDDIDPDTAANPEPEESYEDYEKEEPFDRLYNETYHAVPERSEERESPYEDDDEPDISFLEADETTAAHRRRRQRPAPKLGWLSKVRKGKRGALDDDPFSVDDAEFYDPDDEADFLQRLQEAPPAQQDDDFSSLYPDRHGGASGDLTPTDWRTGYSVYNSAVEPPAPNRRARRQRRERQSNDQQ